MEGSPFLSFYVDIEFLWKIFLFVMVGIAAVSLIYAGSGTQPRCPPSQKEKSSIKILYRRKKTKTGFLPWKEARFCLFTSI